MKGPINRNRVSRKPLITTKRSVLFLAPFPPPFGGISVHAYRLAAGLEQSGWIVNRVAAGRTEPTRGTTTTFVSNSVIRHALAVARARDTIVHIHDRISVLTFLACATAKLRRMRVVITKHGVPRRILRNGDGVDIFLAGALRMADQVIAVNTHVEELLRPYVRKSIQICPAYLPPSNEELEALNPAVSEWLGQSGHAPIVMLMVYRLLPPVFQRQDVYGLSLARKAIVEAVARGSDFRFALLLACPPEGGEEQSIWRREIELLRSALGPRLGVFVGAFAPPLLARTEILIRPTLTDGDAVSIREGLDLGCQVIASNAVPRPDCVLVHDKADSDQLATLIVAAIARAPGRVRRRERDSTTLKKHIGIYESLLT